MRKKGGKKKKNRVKMLEDLHLKRKPEKMGLQGDP